MLYAPSRPGGLARRLARRAPATWSPPKIESGPATMTKEESLPFATIEELSALLAKRKVSPVELTEEFLRRIERYNSQLNAYLTVTAEHALAAARRAEKELPRGR